MVAEKDTGCAVVIVYGYSWLQMVKSVLAMVVVGSHTQLHIDTLHIYSDHRQQTTVTGPHT